MKAVVVIVYAGDRIISVNGETVTGRTYAQVVQLIQKSGNYLHLLVVPKEDDILQLVSYALWVCRELDCASDFVF